MGLDVLDRVVAGVGVERIDRVHAVHPVAAAVAALEYFHMDPMLAFMQPGERDAAKIANARAHLLWDGLRERLHHRIGQRIARTEARNYRRWKDRIDERAARRDDLDRPCQTGVLRHIAIDRAVEQDRAEREPDRAIDCAL